MACTLRWKLTTPSPRSTRAATSSNLGILSDDADSPDNGTLGVYSVGAHDLRVTNRFL